MPLADINISKANDECIVKLIEKKYFDNDKTAAQFAASFALANSDLTKHGKLDDYKPVEGYKNNKWHTNDVDSDRFYRDLIKLYYPNVEDEDRAFRSVISIGLDLISKVIDSRYDWNIVDLYE